MICLDSSGWGKIFISQNKYFSTEPSTIIPIAWTNLTTIDYKIQDMHIILILIWHTQTENWSWKSGKLTVMTVAKQYFMHRSFWANYLHGKPQRYLRRISVIRLFSSLSIYVFLCKPNFFSWIFNKFFDRRKGKTGQWRHSKFSQMHSIDNCGNIAICVLC